MKRRLHFLFTLAVLSLNSVVAQITQTDVTEQYMVNADLSVDVLYYGWDCEWRQDYWSPSLPEHTNVVEFYSGWGGLEHTSFSMSQTVSLPAGDYRIEVGAFYRNGDEPGDGKNDGRAYIFAGTAKQDVHVLYGNMLNAYWGSNALQQAANAFYYDDFRNNFEFSLAKDGEIEIGFAGRFDEMRSWIAIGPMKLYRITYSSESDRLAAAKERAQQRVEALSPVGYGVFQYHPNAISAALAAISAARSVDEVNAVSMPETTKPEADKYYYISLCATNHYYEYYLNMDGLSYDDGMQHVYVASQAPVYFVDMGNDTYALTDGKRYLNYKGDNKWNLTATTEPYGWSIVAQDDGSYNIGGANGLLGTEYTVGYGANCYGNKDKSTNSQGGYCDWAFQEAGTAIRATSVTLPLTAAMNIGETRLLTPTIQPSNASFSLLRWTSLNESVAQVDGAGNVRGTGAGTTTIIASTIDGSEIVATCDVTVTNNVGSKESIIINEIMSANVDMFVDPSWNYGGWVELYNPTTSSVNIGGYYVSDDPTNLKKARIPSAVGNVPAGGYLTIWFDHIATRKDYTEGWVNTQIDMKLEVDGSAIYISDANGKLITSQIYPKAIMRTSYARTTDGGDTWGYTAYPTPTASNNGSRFAKEQLPAPTVDKDGQMYQGSMQVSVSIPQGATLRYTTDGSTPTETNGRTSTTGLFSFSNETAVYRFRLFREGYLPSDVVTRTYIYKDRNYYLPVVAVATDPVNLYDNTLGVWVTGTNGKSANGESTKRNFNMDWDRPVNFEYLVDNEEVLNQEVTFSISGGWSRRYAEQYGNPKSFKLKANSLYGLSRLEYPFYAEKPYNRDKSVLLRNGGNDYYQQYRIKDASLQEVARRSGFKLNYQAYQPAHVFLNGEYKGMLNMRETSNKHYGYANYGIDTDEIDAFEMSVDSGYVQKEGTKEAFKHWYDLTTQLKSNPTSTAIYKQICDVVDIDDYVNYMAYKFFLCDWDWPHNNCKGFRDRNDGKFHFVVFDLDNCVDRSSSNIFNDFAGKQWHTFYPMPEFGNRALTLEVELVTIFLNMLEHEEFKKKFIDTYCIVGGSVFGDEEEIRSIVNGIAQNVREALLWENNMNYYNHDPIGSAKEQSQGIINAITGNFKRNMMNMMKNYSRFNLGSTEMQTLQLSSNVDGAAITYNGMEVPRSKFNGYSFAPVTLKAQEMTGYEFVGWQELDPTGNSTATTIVPFGSRWNYFTEDLDGTGWENGDFPYWDEGIAPFGHGSYGKPMYNAETWLENYHLPTYYFGKTVSLDHTPTADETYTITIHLDDAAIAYVNGTEVGRFNLPDWADVHFYNYVQDFHNVWTGDDPDVVTFTIPNSLLRKGNNWIAVEVHDCNSTSSDIWFDASIAYTSTAGAGTDADYVSTDAEYTIPASGSHSLMAVYKPVSTEAMLAQGITPVRINEVSAANSIYVNEYYKKNDWFELYNTTDQSIDVAGMYVSDNENKPQKYQIPASQTVNTIIPAHGYLVVWCDQLDPISQLHTTFKLAADGGSVLITEANSAWADTLRYQAHDGTATVGRYPDGSNDVYAMNTPTIGKRNILSSYDTPNAGPGTDDDPGTGDDDDPGTDTGIMIAHDGGLRTMYDAGHIIVRSEEAQAATLTVYTSAGQTVSTHTLDLSAGHATAYVGNLPKGIYIANVKSTEAETCICKFIIK